MISPRKPHSLPPTTVVRSAAARDGTGSGAYNQAFWLTYLANWALMMAISLLFRYADFVKYLGGGELLLGWIVGIGMVGSLAMRMVQGVGIDLYGVRRIWLLSIAGFIAACLGHLFVQSASGPAIFGLRILYNSSVAGFFGASITFISRRAPMSRMAEVVGTLGTSGFVGMVTGTLLGDWLFGPGAPSGAELQRMFLAAAGLAALSFALSLLATRGQVPPVRRRQPPLPWLLRRYHPGPVLATGVAMGFGLGLPTIFLRPYTESLGIDRMAAFFAVYTGFAFVARMTSRQWPNRMGVRPMILIGLASLIISVLLYLPVRSEWHLIAPAIFLGGAHAWLFPAVIAGGSASFPARYRGLGTTLILSTLDIGTLFGYPLVGGILAVAQRAGLPKYPTMFVSVATLLSLVSLYYLLGSRGGATRQGPRISRVAKDARVRGKTRIPRETAAKLPAATVAMAGEATQEPPG